MRIAAPTIVLSLFLIPALALANTTDRLDDGEVIVTSEDVDGFDDPRITVQGVIDVPPQRVWDVVSDCNIYEDVMPSTEEARVVRTSGSTVICEVTIGLPFPLSDLTAQTRGEHTEGPPEWRREWELIEGDYHHNSGSWQLRTFQGDANRTLVTYSILAVPKSRIPDRIRNYAQERSMPGIIEELRDHLK